MKIANIEIDDECLTAFIFEGIAPDMVKSISQDGSNRSSVVKSVAYSYAMSLNSIDKKKYDELFSALRLKALTFNKIKIDMNSVMRTEIPEISLLDNSAIEFEFDISQMKPINRGGYYEMTIPLKYIEY